MTKVVEAVNICKECGVDFFTMDPRRMLCHPCIHLSRNVELKLFECRILWEDERGISRFTLLHKSEALAQATVLQHLDELGYSEKDISAVAIGEHTGPFDAGFLVHQEFCYMSESEFKSKEF